MVQNKLKGIKNSYIRDINFLIYRIDWNSFFPIKKKYHDDRVVNSEICLGKFCLGNQWWQFGCKKEWKRDSKYKNSWDVKKIRSKDYRSFKNVIKLGFYQSLEAITFITSFSNLLLSYLFQFLDFTLKLPRVPIRYQIFCLQTFQNSSWF